MSPRNESATESSEPLVHDKSQLAKWASQHFSTRQCADKLQVEPAILTLDHVEATLAHLANEKAALLKECTALLDEHAAELGREVAVLDQVEKEAVELVGDVDTIKERMFGDNGLAHQIQATLSERASQKQRELEIDGALYRMKRAERARCRTIAQLLDQSTTSSRNHVYLDAALAMKEAQRKADRGAAKWPDLVLYRNVAKHVANMRAKLVADLEALARAHVTRSDIHVQIAFQRDASRWSDVLEALATLGSPVHAITDLVWLDAVHRDLRVEYFHDRGEEEEPAGVTIELLDQPTDIVANVVAYAGVLARVLPAPSRAAVVQPIVLSLLETYSRDVLAVQLPTHPSGLPAFDELLRNSVAMAAAFIDAGLAASVLDSLTTFDTKSRYFAKKLGVVLGVVRHLVTANDSDEVAVPFAPSADTQSRIRAALDATEPASSRISLTSRSTLLSTVDPLRFPSCLISRKVQQLVTFLDELVAELADFPDSSWAPHQYALVERSLDLYLVSAADTAARQQPRAGVLAHNDAMFLSDWVAKQCLVDAHAGSLALHVAVLEDHAKQALSAQLFAQKSDMVALIKPVEVWFADLTLHRQDIEARFLQVNRVLRQISDAIKPAVPAPLHLYFIGALYDTCLTHVLNEIFAWEDITADESEELCSLLQGLLVPAHLFAVADDQQIEWVSHYRVFYDTVETLNLSFKEIMDRFRARRYAQFRRGQLMHLVQALFQDSELRRANLAEMMAGVEQGLVLP
ncbi:Centromere/kinetochore protein zw10 [Allomyces javanicus]|nr:Centromere/kinetochore protein zw10 [Allomyces javanicus]